MLFVVVLKKLLAVRFSSVQWSKIGETRELPVSWKVQPQDARKRRDFIVQARLKEKLYISRIPDINVESF